MSDSSEARVNGTQTGALVASFGGLLLLAAWLLGITAVTSDGIDCGSAFGGDKAHTWVDTDSDDTCSAKLDSRQAVVWTLAGVGTGVVVLGVIVAGNARSTERHD